MTTKRAYQYRFYPDQQQEKLLAQTFGCVRFVYNSILRYRTDAYDQTQEKIGYTAANARLTAIKKLPEFAFLNDISSVPLQQCLRNQQTAFKNFWLNMCFRVLSFLALQPSRTAVKLAISDNQGEAS